MGKSAEVHVQQSLLVSHERQSWNKVIITMVMLPTSAIADQYKWGARLKEEQAAASGARMHGRRLVGSNDSTMTKWPFSAQCKPHRTHANMTAALPKSTQKRALLLASCWVILQIYLHCTTFSSFNPNELEIVEAPTPTEFPRTLHYIWPNRNFDFLPECTLLWQYRIYFYHDEYII